MDNQDNGFGSCVFCGAKAQRQRQRIAGDACAVCEVCAGAGRIALDAGTMQAALGCLHLTACEVERALDPERGRQRRALSRIRAAFERSEFRAVCACATCSTWQVDDDLGLLDEPAEHFYMVDGVPVFTDLDLEEIPLWVLRSMSPRARVPGPDGERVSPDAAVPLWKDFYREETQVPCETVARLEALRGNVKAPGGWITLGAAAERLAEKRAASDAAAHRHWEMVRKYGPGLRDGDWWIVRGGEGLLIPLEAVDRVFPMTAADKLALAHHQKRDIEAAQRWRDGIADELDG
jgi:hypothetical protein